MKRVFLVLVILMSQFVAACIQLPRPFIADQPPVIAPHTESEVTVSLTPVEINSIPDGVSEVSVSIQSDILGLSTRHLNRQNFEVRNGKVRISRNFWKLRYYRESYEISGGLGQGDEVTILYVYWENGRDILNYTTTTVANVTIKE